MPVLESFPFYLKLAAAIIIPLLLALIARKGLNKVAEKFRLNDALLTFLQATIPIITFFIIGYALVLIAELVVEYYQLEVNKELISQLRSLLILFFVTWLLFSWKSKYEALIIKNVQEKKGIIRDISLITGVSKFLSLMLIILAALVTLGILKINYTALLAFGGLGGIAVSWAAKDVIANFFGGLMIHINRPFSIGDWIKSTNKNFEGIVEQIGWYMTRIRSLERRPTYIPNALITDAIIENPGRMYHRRIRTTVGLRYEDYERVPKIIDAIKEALQSHPDISKSQSIMVHLTAFSPSSLDIEVYCFTRKTQQVEFRDIQQEVLFMIAAIIKECGAEMAYPTQTIHLTKDHS